MIKTIRGRRRREKRYTATVLLAVEKSWRKTISRLQFINVVPVAVALLVAYIIVNFYKALRSIIRPPCVYHIPYFGNS